MNEEKIFLNREIVYSSGMFIYVGVYFILISLISKILSEFNIGLNTFFSVLAAIAVAFGFFAVLSSKSLKERIKKFVDKNIYRGKFDYRRIWHEFSENMSSVVKLDYALDIIVSKLKNWFNLSNVVFLLSENGDNTYVSQLASEKLSLKLDEKAKDWFIRYDKPLPVNEKYSNQYTKPLFKIMAEIIDMNSQKYALPLVYKRDLIGFIICCLGNGNNLSRQEIELLKTLSTESAIVINNLLMTQELIYMKKIETYHRLASFVVHDVKNLISRLKLVIDNAEQNMSDPEFQKDMLNTISNSVFRMTDLINKIKLSVSENNLLLHPESIPDVINDVLKELNVFQNPAINLEDSIDKKGPLLKIDRDQLYKVIENVIINAIEAMPSGGKLKIATFYNEESYSIEINDTGKGMSQQFISEKLFQPFYSTKERGLGIGMYQSNEIIKAHKGNIKVKSTIKKGASFTIRLPIFRSLNRENSVVQGVVETQAIAL